MWTRRRATRWVVALAFALVVAAAGGGPAWGHEVRPALLQIVQMKDGRYDVLWKQPSVGAMRVHLAPSVSGGLLDQSFATSESAPDFQILRWRGLDAGAAGLDGRTLRIEGLSRTMTDVLVSISLADGESAQSILHPQDAALTLRLHPTGIAVSGYFLLGATHILTGIDHLCFVLALMLLVRRPLALIKTITAFTVAHSLTLVATTLRLLTVQTALIETLVALSIVFVAVEIAHGYRGRATLSARYPWMIAFAFGLLHGSAFAGALAEVGLPSTAIPASLLLFNVGVECGQLLFIAAVLSIHQVVTRRSAQWPSWSRWVPPYAIGSLAAVWFFQRLYAAVT